MPMHLTEENRQIGRRNFLKAMAATPALAAAAGFTYTYKAVGGPVKVGIIGFGDQCRALMNNADPEFVKAVAVADIFPVNRELGHRFIKAKFDPEAKAYEDYKELLEDKNVEAVITAAPLFMHKQIVCDALNAGKHVLCEKLMAYSVAECKEMIALAEKKGLVLQIGHQRHYSALYRQALEYVQSGKLGDIYHIDAFWHRDTKWTRPMPATGQDVVTQFFNKAAGEVNGANTWYKLPPADAKRLKDALTSVDTDTAARLHKESMSLDWSKWGFKDFLQFRQWRLFKKYSQGLMAELGSHQLDACGILLGHKHPVDVVGNGFQVEQDFREVADHIYAQFTYPGKVTVTYSSIISNNFRNYGEMVFGTKGTLIIEAEQDLMLFESTKAGAPKPTEVKVEAPAAAAAAGKPPATTVDASSSAPADWGGGAGKAASGPASAGRGYKEEIQHFAVCVRTGDLSKEKPRCDGRQALGDAVIALKANEAIVSGQRLKFSDDEFKA